MKVYTVQSKSSQIPQRPCRRRGVFTNNVPLAFDSYIFLYLDIKKPKALYIMIYWCIYAKRNSEMPKLKYQIIFAGIGGDAIRAQMKLFTLHMDPSKIDINRVRVPDQSVCNQTVESWKRPYRCLLNRPESCLNLFISQVFKSVFLTAMFELAAAYAILLMSSRNFSSTCFVPR